MDKITFTIDHERWSSWKLILPMRLLAILTIFAQALN
jgi:hypothetical protein